MPFAKDKRLLRCHDHGERGQSATVPQRVKERSGVVFTPARPAEGELDRREPGEGPLEMTVYGEAQAFERRRVESFAGADQSRSFGSSPGGQLFEFHEGWRRTPFTVATRALTITARSPRPRAAAVTYFAPVVARMLPRCVTFFQSASLRPSTAVANSRHDSSNFLASSSARTPMFPSWWSVWGTVVGCSSCHGLDGHPGALDSEVSWGPTNAMRGDPQPMRRPARPHCGTGDDTWRTRVRGQGCSSVPRSRRAEPSRSPWLTWPPRSPSPRK